MNAGGRDGSLANECAEKKRKKKKYQYAQCVHLRRTIYRQPALIAMIVTALCYAAVFNYCQLIHYMAPRRDYASD